MQINKEYFANYIAEINKYFNIDNNYWKLIKIYFFELFYLNFYNN